jgi:hypothetical protein
MRKFLSRILGFQVDTPRTNIANPVQESYEDAYKLVDAIFRGDPWSRRAWEKRIGQSRWERATDLLRAADILDRKGRYIFDPARDLETARGMLLDAANAEATRRLHRRYVSAR